MNSREQSSVTSASTDSAGVRKLAPEMTDEMTEQTGSVSFLTNSTAVEIPRWNSAVSTMEMVHPVRYIWYTVYVL